MVFDTLYGGLTRGRLSCKCSKSYRKTLAEKEAEIQEVCKVSDCTYVPPLIKKGYKDYVKVLCHKHNTTSVGKLYNFTHGYTSCQECCNEKVRAAQIAELTDYLDKFNSIHKNKFDYSQADYKGYDTKLEVICPTHGSFWISPNAHCQGIGCSNCTVYGYKEKHPCYLYVVKMVNNELPDNVFCKFGISIDKKDRYRQHELSTNDKYKTVEVFARHFTTSDQAKFIEDTLKKLPIKRKVVSRDVMRSGFTETFNIEDLDLVSSQAKKFCDYLAASNED